MSNDTTNQNHDLDISDLKRIALEILGETEEEYNKRKEKEAIIRIPDDIVFPYNTTTKVSDVDKSKVIQLWGFKWYVDDKENIKK